MKTRAAIAFEVGKPLVVDEVDLEGPKAGEVMVELRATGVWPLARIVVEF
jgi:S-(hydroxymethyl)glutathione dehydrogenase/alcohol dehydrogenase